MQIDIQIQIGLWCFVQIGWDWIHYAHPGPWTVSTGLGLGENPRVAKWNFRDISAFKKWIKVENYSPLKITSVFSPCEIIWHFSTAEKPSADVAFSGTASAAATENRFHGHAAVKACYNMNIQTYIFCYDRSSLHCKKAAKTRISAEELLIYLG